MAESITTGGVASSPGVKSHAYEQSTPLSALCVVNRYSTNEICESARTQLLRSAATSTAVFAAEPKGADDAARSLAAGKRILQTGPDTIADGLLTSLGELNWPIIRDHVERIFTVSDDEIQNAMELLWGRAKLLVEPSAATVLAAVLTDEFRELPGLSRIGLVLSDKTARRRLDDDDEDADPEDLEIWQARLKDLTGLLGSSDWREADI